MESNVSKTLYQNGSVWVVKTSTYTGTDRLNAGDLDKDPEDILDIFKLGRKYLLPSDIRVKISGVPGKVNALMNRAGTPFFLPAATFVPFKNTLLTKEGLEKIKADHLETGIQLAEQLPKLKKEMIQNYPVLATANWPTSEQIISKFHVRWIVFEVSEVGAMEADPQDLINAKDEFRKELKEGYDSLKKEILQEAHAGIIEACDVIAAKIFETGDKITKATIKKPMNIIEKYSQVAELFDLEDIKVKVAELKATLEASDAKVIRGDWGTAKALGDNLKRLADDIDDLSGYSSDGTLKRKIKFKKAA